MYSDAALKQFRGYRKPNSLISAYTYVASGFITELNKPPDACGRLYDNRVLFPLALAPPESGRRLGRCRSDFRSPPARALHNNWITTCACAHRALAADLEPARRCGAYATGETDNNSNDKTDEWAVKTA
ncbi:jg1200 [Pararge aegeria aegeria]|uniref:Jg1200 protein n=1 Tax=Pararge aegeria aegeria TaxID=348720 RepID=A0A8S4R989_9NEOP|nr:jg1200 [Pararge aegeria aegeria]